MSPRLSPAASRALALALLTATLLLVYLALVRPYLAAFAGYQERRGELAHQQARYQAMIDYRAELTAKVEQLQGLPQFNSFFLQQDTPSLAAAALESQVKRSVAATGGRMISMQMVPATGAEEGLSPVTITVNVGGTVETLRALIHSLETGSPLLFLDNVTVAPSRTAPSRSR